MSDSNRTGPSVKNAPKSSAGTDREVGIAADLRRRSPLDTRLQGRGPAQDHPPGRHIARPKRYSRNFAEEVEPDQLVDEVVTQAERGDGWVKIVKAN